MKDETLADLGYIKLYLEGYLRDNKTLSEHPKKYNKFSLQRCLELVDDIKRRETKNAVIFLVYENYYLFGDKMSDLVGIYFDEIKAKEQAELIKKTNKHSSTYIQKSEVHL